MVFIKRYKKTAAQNPRGQGTNYNRILGDAEVMVAAFEGELSVARQLAFYCTTRVYISLTHYAWLG